MATFLRACLAGVLIVWICLAPLVACYDEDQENQRNVEAQLQAQIEEEQVRRCQAEQAARSAEQSRAGWIAGVSAGAFGACVIVGMLGVHIGSRARRRSGKEATNG
jgi:hypothetical protein